MEYSFINEKILELFTQLNIKSFPLNCEYIVKELGYNLYKYSELSEEKRIRCLMVSDESLKLHYNIYYNDNMLVSRIRFSIAHELGHIVLNHGDYLDSEKEKEANYFASNLIAPRIAIHYAKCKNHIDVSKLFNLSQEAAQYAFNDYKRWYRKTVYNKMNVYDKEMYRHFYSIQANCFVYNVKICANCGSEILNSTQAICSQCDRSHYEFVSGEDAESDFMIAESQWLYGGI